MYLAKTPYWIVFPSFATSLERPSFFASAVESENNFRRKVGFSVQYWMMLSVHCGFFSQLIDERGVFAGADAGINSMSEEAATGCLGLARLLRGLGGGFGVGSKLSLRFAMSRRQRFLEDRKQNFINYIRKGGNGAQ